MSNKIAYIVDSTTLLTEKILKKLRVEIVSLSITINSISCKEIETPDSKIIENLENAKTLKSSAPSPTDFVNAYNKLFEEGYTDIIVIPISKGLSGTLQTANIAKNSLENQELVNHIHIIDTNCCNYANTNLIEASLDFLLDETKTVQEKVEYLNEISKNVTTMFTLSDLKHLFRGGRLSRLSCVIGSLLRIKPIIKMTDGKLGLYKKKFTDNQIYSVFDEVFKNYSENYEHVSLKLINLNKQKQMEELKKMVETKYKNIEISSIERVGPVFLVHLGNNGYGITITGIKKRK